MRLGVHDPAPVWRGATPGDALRESVELARQVERLGYHRYWVAEHHATPALASSSPAVLASHILGATSTIRVGAGVVLLPYHSPLTIAEQFGTLAALHPGRTDLGIGRGQGGPEEASRRLGQGRRQSYAEQFAELAAYLDGTSPLPASPRAAASPEIVIVGNSESSAEFAGRAGLPYIYAELFRPGLAAPTLALYRKAFHPTPDRPAPVAGVAVGAVLADTDEEALRLARAFVLGQLIMRTADPHTLLPTADEAASIGLTAAQEAFVAEKLAPTYVGSPATVEPRFTELVESSRAEELLVISPIPGLDHRTHSYELLASLLR
ncbi:MsnO8 family LLM class oxidoreductase [Frankia sp. CNm7]|uniref:MsnO8 family LLM class oxidoreductase n=1 Tax=Frankia nepalensis TaxID=1836974 RepID=A0A937RES4_9ACTN|nr:MsnO8 family LLM class oxidoreductase [Frankia nepalensis]MBL7498940.1 MsnO8 family LLM class oxidoreductase [Frankia nepalensis]MBL7511263.1 MsnO8 family LLM class oxidoreductase [Frankia nepalensis]MBL7520563.1 MsnO8 family LLM class oxidoreductase [Frankia nepalensis]MBL7630783.1 MsnO8 family LLM class oxidoreductase [Frankia nepalensis]